MPVDLYPIQFCPLRLRNSSISSEEVYAGQVTFSLFEAPNKANVAAKVEPWRPSKATAAIVPPFSSLSVSWSSDTLLARLTIR